MFLNKYKFDHVESFTDRKFFNLVEKISMLFVLALIMHNISTILNCWSINANKSGLRKTLLRVNVLFKDFKRLVLRRVFGMFSENK